MSNSLELIFFDINNIVYEDIYEEDEKKMNDEEEENEEKIKKIPKKEKLIPYKIIEHFLYNIILIDLEIEESEKFNTYSFIYQVQRGIAKQCKLYLFKSLCQEAFNVNSNGLFIFCELQNEKTEELLDKLIEFIKKTSIKDIKLYIIGVMYPNKKNLLTEENIKNLFDEEGIDYKYDEIIINPNNNSKLDDSKSNNNISIDIKNEDNNINNIINIKNEDEDNNINNINNINNDNNIDNEININNKNNEDNDSEQDNTEKNDDGTELNDLEEEIYEKTDKSIEDALVDIYTYQKENSHSYNKLLDREINNGDCSRCKIF